MRRTLASNDACAEAEAHGRGSGAEGRGPARLTFFLDHLRGGGLQKVWVTLAGALASRGHEVDLAVCEPDGPLRDELHERVRLVGLPRSPRWQATAAAARLIRATAVSVAYPVLAHRLSATFPFLPGLAGHLRARRPDAALAASPYMNIEAGLARRLAGVSSRLIVSEHIHLTPEHALSRGWSGRLLPALLRMAYDEASAVVAVSHGVAADMARRTGISGARIRTIYNPIVPPDLEARARAPLDHPWFAPGAPPVVLGAGRLGAAKDFPTLLRATALALQHRRVHLVIIGDASSPDKTAKRQAELMRLADELGIAGALSLPGYVPNPFAYMARAAVFVLSSIHEGFGNVVAEALACGCPVVSTDCPSGPAEILDDGRFGALVPVRDPNAMADAILRTIDSPPERAVLTARAEMFTIARSVDQWAALLQSRGVAGLSALGAVSARARC